MHCKEVSIPYTIASLLCECASDADIPPPRLHAENEYNIHKLSPENWSTRWIAKPEILQHVPHHIFIAFHFMYMVCCVCVFRFLRAAGECEQTGTRRCCVQHYRDQKYVYVCIWKNVNILHRLHCILTIYRRHNYIYIKCTMRAHTFTLVLGQIYKLIQILTVIYVV